MSRETVDKICKSLPGVEWSDPWGGGHDAWKVADKMFACIGSMTPGVSVKTPDIETAEMLIAAGVAMKAPYFHKSWVRLDWDMTPEDILRERIEASYRIIVSSLSKKKQAELQAL